MTGDVVLDTSAVIAILTDEPDRAEIVSVLESATSVSISAATYVEAAVVLDRRGDPVRRRQLDALLRLLGATVVALDEAQARAAAEAHRDFGRGSGHPARLNLGDCYSYALASVTDRPLLFKGDDFVHTDLRSALPR